MPLTVGALDHAGDRGGTLQDAVGGRLLAGTITANGARTRGAGSSPETLVANPLRAQHNASHRLDSDTYVPVLATALRGRSSAKGPDSDATDTLLAYGGNRQSGPLDVATAVNAHGGPHGRLDFETETFVVAHTLRANGADASEDGSGRGTPLVVTPFDTTQITSATNYSNPQPGDPCHPLGAQAQAHAPAIAFTSKDHGQDAGTLAPTLRAMSGRHANAGGQVAIAFNARQDPDVSGDISGPLDTDAGTHAVLTSGVRRLMPVECERLQGVPDHFTRIPWRGQPEDLCPDGPRYRCLGNAYPRPVLAWIGRRIGVAVQPATPMPIAAE